MEIVSYFVAVESEPYSSMKVLFIISGLLSGLLLQAQDTIPVKPVPVSRRTAPSVHDSALHDSALSEPGQRLAPTALSSKFVEARAIDSVPVRSRIPDHNYFTLYAEPVALLDFENGPSYRFGAEYAFAHNWAIYGGAGGYFQQGYILRAGIKKYFDVGEPVRSSLGLEYINIWHVYTIHDFYFKEDSLEGRVPDDSRPVSITAEKYINSVSFMYTEEHFWRHRWILEFYAGAGIKFKHVLTSIPKSEEELLYHYHESDLEYVSYTPGKFITADIRLGIRIGRVFAH